MNLNDCFRVDECSWWLDTLVRSQAFYETIWRLAVDAAGATKSRLPLHWHFRGQRVLGDYTSRRAPRVSLGMCHGRNMVHGPWQELFIVPLSEHKACLIVSKPLFWWGVSNWTPDFFRQQQRWHTLELTPHWMFNAKHYLDVHCCSTVLPELFAQHPNIQPFMVAHPS